MSKRKNKRRNATRAKVVGTLAFLLMAGMLWQMVMTKRECSQYAPQGAFIEVGSYDMHYYCKGEGELAFLLITGSGTPCAYTDFYQLQQSLSNYGRTVSFDHAGFGWSSKTSEKREIAALTKEIHMLLENLVPEHRKVIVVCHSLGSLEAIHYAKEYPEEVKGVIFLDGGSPEFYSRDSELKSIAMNRALAGIRMTGIARLFATVGGVIPVYGESVRNQMLEEPLRSLDLAMYERYLGNGENLSVIHNMNENAEAVCKDKTLGDLPILVLSSDSGGEWQKVQEQLAFWSKKSRQVTIKGADHYLHWSNDKEVEKEIIDYIKQVN